MKEIGIMEKSMEKENLYKMEKIIMKENLLREKKVEKVYIFGIKINTLKEGGKIINKMVMGFIFPMGK